MSQEKQVTSELMDDEMRKALEEGLLVAGADWHRRTPQQVRADAEEIGKEWRERLSLKASAYLDSLR